MLAYDVRYFLKLLCSMFIVHRSRFSVRSTARSRWSANTRPQCVTSTTQLPTSQQCQRPSANQCPQTVDRLNNDVIRFSWRGMQTRRNRSRRNELQSQVSSFLFDDVRHWRRSSTPQPSTYWRCKTGLCLLMCGYDVSITVYARTSWNSASNVCNCIILGKYIAIIEVLLLTCYTVVTPEVVHVVWM